MNYFFFGGLGGQGMGYLGPGAPPPSFLFTEDGCFIEPVLVPLLFLGMMRPPIYT